MARKTVAVPMNRVEGDLEVTVELDEGVVVDARCTGTMYRGFERILVGRASLDGLVIAPRICGLCSVSHQTAAALALDAMVTTDLPPDAVRIRNVTLMAENIQSDIRQAFLMYTADFVNPLHAECALHDEAVARYTPFAGETVRQVIAASKGVVDLIAAFAGMWPHASFMVPGGITSIPSAGDLLFARSQLAQYRAFYERRILGCTIERWREIRGVGALDAWLDERRVHRDGDLGFFIRFARAVGLDRIGRGTGAFLSFGALDVPEGSAVAPGAEGRLVPGGFVHGDDVRPFDQARVAEHVASSWFEDTDGGLHPFAGETNPYASGAESGKYSWMKAPRYEGAPCEVGPLAELMVMRDPLFVDLVGRSGPSAFVRQLARIVRATHLIPVMETWLGEVAGDGHFYSPPGDIVEGRGFGLTEAARGALGHWVEIADGRIELYQVITPTTWNASPRDADGRRGPMEEALVGTRVTDASNPVELGHVVRSFDPCLVCAVHAVSRGERAGDIRVGGLA